MDIKNYIVFLGLMVGLGSLPLISSAAEAEKTPPAVLTIVNKTDIPLSMVCGTVAKPGYIQQPFIDPNKPETKNFQIKSGLFLNETDPVTCSFYRVNSLTPVPHDFSLEFGFLLVPAKVGDQLMVRSYVEQKSSLDVVTTYSLDGTTGALTVTFTSFFPKNSGPQPNPSQLMPVPR